MNNLFGDFYQPSKDEEDMQNTKDVTELILAGARSCALALNVLTKSEPGDLAYQSAAAVLETWGIKLIPVVARRERPVLKWPPSAPRLPAVYRENYYHVREDTYAMGPDRVAADVPLTPEHQLVLREGDAETEWATTAQCWWLHMTIINKTHETHNLGCWILSKYVVPSDEISKNP